MTTVTISRQMGSLGSQIALQLAERLGFRPLWRDLINQAARQAGTPDVALAAIDELGLLDVCPSHKACQAYRREVENIILDLAAKGRVIIVGRGGHLVLRNRPDVLRVRITAPVDLRAARIAGRSGVTIECARAQIDASDRFRKNYMRRFYRAAVDDLALYDLVLNTACITPDQAVEILAAAVDTLPSGS